MTKLIIPFNDDPMGHPPSKGDIPEQTDSVQLQVSRLVFQEDGTVTIKGTLTLEKPITFLHETIVLPDNAVVTNMTMEPNDPSVMQVEDMPVSIENVLKT